QQGGPRLGAVGQGPAAAGEDGRPGAAAGELLRLRQGAAPQYLPPPVRGDSAEGPHHRGGVMAQTTVPPSLKWHGGKQYLAARIVGLMPPRQSDEHPDGWCHYVEPYFGGGAVLLANDPEGISEAVNDLDGRLINFWKVLQHPDYFPAFERFTEAVPF